MGEVGGGGGGGRGGDRERGDALRSGSLVPADNSATSNERRNSNSSEGYGGGVILRPETYYAKNPVSPVGVMALGKSSVIFFF